MSSSSKDVPLKEEYIPKHADDFRTYYKKNNINKKNTIKKTVTKTIVF